MAYACKVLADSISPAGHRLTSFEVTFPRIVLAEMNTHCMLSRNSASSRAIPIAKRLAAVQADPFIPELFGRNQKGMQPAEALDGDEARKANLLWAHAGVAAIGFAGELAELGVHKQYANRLLEPFSWHTAVITATDWDNFEHLRCSPLAQGELRKAAELMMVARDGSFPQSLRAQQHHAPYVDTAEAIEIDAYGLEPWKVSVGRCARVSYLTQNGGRDPAEDVALADRLLESGHMSPFEHVARPMTQFELMATRAYDLGFDDGPIIRTQVVVAAGAPEPYVGERIPHARCGEGVTITYVRGPLHYAGKLNGWISRRQFIHGEHDILGHRNVGAR